MRRKTFNLPGGRMAGVEFGPEADAPDVVFLHANGFNAMTYRAALDADLRVLAVDMRGHGRSELPTETAWHRWGVYADDLTALLATLPRLPRVLAGHSMGGATCLLAAPRLADMRLLLFDPVIATPEHYDRGAGLDWQQPLVKGALRRRARFASRGEALAAYRGRGAFATWPDGTITDYLEDGLRYSPEGGLTLACAPAWEAANFAAYASSDPRPGLAAGGVRILRAQHGSTCNVAGDEISGTTHFLPMERPDLVQAALRDMLAENRQNSLLLSFKKEVLF